MTAKTQTRIRDVRARAELHRKAYTQKLITTDMLGSIGQELVTELQQIIAEDDTISAEEFHRIFNRIQKEGNRMRKTFKLLGKFIDKK